MKGFWVLFSANLKEFVRDRAGLFWTFALPLSFVFLFGVIFSGERQDISFDYVLPGILAMALMQLGLFGAMQFLSLRERKIVRGLSITPISRVALLGSEILLRLLAGFVQAGIILAFGVGVFGVRLVGPIHEVLALVLLGSAAFVSLGYLLICFARSMESGSGIAQVVQLPMMFLAGVFFPVELMPEFMQPVVRVIPLKFLADALREVMTGVPAEFSLTMNAGFLSLFLGLTLVAAIRFWRWE